MNPPKFDGATDRSTAVGRSSHSCHSCQSERGTNWHLTFTRLTRCFRFFGSRMFLAVFSLMKYIILLHMLMPLSGLRNDNDTYLEGPPRAPSPFLPSSLLREVQTVEMCPAIFLSFGRRNWVSNNSCCHAGPTAAKSQRTKVMARGKRSQSSLGTTAI